MVPADDYTWRGQLGWLINGMPIEVDPRDIVGPDILAWGVWEEETANFLLSWLRPGMTFVDAGVDALKLDVEGFDLAVPPDQEVNDALAALAAEGLTR